MLERRSRCDELFMIRYIQVNLSYIIKLNNQTKNPSFLLSVQLTFESEDRNKVK